MKVDRLVRSARRHRRVTSLGVSLGKSVCGLWTWVEAHLRDVERSRRALDVGLLRDRRLRVREPLAETVRLRSTRLNLK